jgi:type IV pilus assembly protein PilP
MVIPIAIVGAFAFLALGARSAAVPSKPAAPAAMQATASETTGLVDDSMFAGLMDAFEYDPRGRKDPFAQQIADRPVAPGASHGPLLPLQQWDIDQFRLVAIIWDVRRPRAMLRDPSGKTHIVGPNTKLGPRNGYIAVIREGEVVVVETIEQDGRLLSTAQVLKIAK